LNLVLSPGIHLFYGENGQGKSNLLEAIYLLSIGKSIRATTERDLVNYFDIQNQPYGQIQATLNKNNQEITLQITINVHNRQLNDLRNRKTTKKHISINHIQKSITELIGNLNAVLFTVNDLNIIDGSHISRRRYLDILISQTDKNYFKMLQKYNYIVSNRNKILKKIRNNSTPTSELAFWNKELISLSTFITKIRMDVLKKITQNLNPIQKMLSNNTDNISLKYVPSYEQTEPINEQSIETAIQKAISNKENYEIKYGFSLFGPHRDQIKILLDGMDLKKYGSRGQFRTAILSIKFAEAEYLKNQIGIEPIILLDDVMSELDSKRRALLINMLDGYKQVLITTTEKKIFESLLESNKINVFHINAGIILKDD
tara:strand:- start:839 stop:1957 length:1119 start_codon:yes stop_codon:yes gene_type:complete